MTVRVPLVLAIAPPWKAAPPVKVLLVTVTVPWFALLMAPPTPYVATSSVNVEFSTVSVPPLFSMAPPYKTAALPVKATPLSVRLPVFKMAPPLVADPSVIVKSLKVSVAVAPVATEKTLLVRRRRRSSMRRRRARRSRRRCAVFVRSRVPNVAESVIVWGVVDVEDGRVEDDRVRARRGRLTGSCWPRPGRSSRCRWSSCRRST